MRELFAVRDEKSGHFLKSFEDSSAVNALRGFELGINEPGNLMSSFPADFGLYRLGSFDPTSGILTGLESPVHLANGASLKRESSVQNTLPFGSPKQ